MCPLIMFMQQFEHLYKVSTGTLANTPMRDATECVNSESIGYGLFAVIKAIFSNPNDLELIVNYIQTIVSINKLI